MMYGFYMPPTKATYMVTTRRLYFAFLQAVCNSWCTPWFKILFWILPDLVRCRTC